MFYLVYPTHVTHGIKSDLLVSNTSIFYESGLLSKVTHESST